jgi:hypothetical protein
MSVSACTGRAAVVVGDEAIPDPASDASAVSGCPEWIVAGSVPIVTVGAVASTRICVERCEQPRRSRRCRRKVLIVYTPSAARVTVVPCGDDVVGVLPSVV